MANLKQAIFDYFPNFVNLDDEVLAARMMNGVTGKLNRSLVIREQSDSWGIAADRCEASRQEYSLFSRIKFLNVLRFRRRQRNDKLPFLRLGDGFCFKV